MPPKRLFDTAFKIRAVEYAKETSGEAAARHYAVDPKRTREWKKQYESLVSAKVDKGASRKRLEGGGTKKVGEELEDRVLSRILEQRRKSVRVSRKIIVNELN